MMSNARVQDSTSHHDPIRPGRIVLAVLVLVLLIGTGAGVLVWRNMEGDTIPPPEVPPDPTPGGGNNQPSSQCNDDRDPKTLEPLHFGPPLSVAFDRRYLNALNDKPIPEVERYPWQPEELVAVLGEHRMRGNLFAVTPDGQTLIVGNTGDANLRFGPTETIHEQHVVVCPGRGPRIMALSPDGKTLAVYCMDNMLRLLDVSDPENLPPPRVLERARGEDAVGLITSLSWSGDGKYLLGGDNTDRRSAWVWDVETKKIENRLQHIGPVRSVAFSPVKGDYRALTAGGPEDGQLHLWADARSDVKPRTSIDFRPSKTDTKTYVDEVAISPDGTGALSCHPGGEIRLWDLDRFEKNAERHVLKGHVGNIAAAFSPDGKYLASARTQRAGVQLWNVEDGKPVRQLATAPAVHSIRFLPDGDRIVFSGSRAGDANLHIHEIATGKEILPPVGHLTGLTCVTILPGGRIVASGAGDGTVRMWDLEGPGQRYAVGAGQVRGVGPHPDGRQVYYFGVSSGNPGLVDTDTGKPTSPTWKSSHQGAVSSAGITIDGHYAVTGGQNDGTVRMWRLADGAEVRTFKGLDGPGSVSVAPDMRRAIRAGGSRTRLLHLRCQEVKHQWNPVAWAPFLPDGRALFLGGSETPVWTITADRVEQTGTMNLNLTSMKEGTLSGDGKRVAAVFSTSVAAFETESGKEIWRWSPPAHFYGIRGVALSPDGGHLMTANGDGTVYVVRLPLVEGGARSAVSKP